MEDYSDLDASLESEYEPDQGSTPGSNSEEDELSENLEPELSEIVQEEYSNAPWNPDAQLQAQYLAQLGNQSISLPNRASLWTFCLDPT